jgi:hypothetical protein
MNVPVVRLKIDAFPGSKIKDYHAEEDRSRGADLSQDQQIGS